MKNSDALRREIERLLLGLDELDQWAAVKRPISQSYLRTRIADLAMHASAAMFQLDVLCDDVTAFHRSVPQK